MMFKFMIIAFSAGLLLGCSTGLAEDIEMSAEVLRDKIRGGLLGQILGNLNGLPHEMKYIDAPGDVREYVPALPQGAHTDDDTDFEWVYIYVMGQEDEIFLPPERIRRLWMERINQRIWCSNYYARHLMDIGFEPPLTGCHVLNPWADFNISGQFLCETFGLLGPGMGQTASRIGLNYTRVAIDGEPAQATQLFCTMIAQAFIETDMEKVLDAGGAALDERSVLRKVIADVRKWYRDNGEDWRATRRQLKETYTQDGGRMRDMNGYELNTGSIIAALLYGAGDVAETLRMAFNFGWDADCNAATAGTIVGVMKGYRWMLQQGWVVVDRYKNTTRDHMPMNETITSFADRVIDLAEKVILGQGGERMWKHGKVVYRIPTETPGNVQALPNLDAQIAVLKTEHAQGIKGAIVNPASDMEKARAAYWAICLDMGETLKAAYPREWARSLEILSRQGKVLENIFDQGTATPAGKTLRDKAIRAGLKPIQ
jgi:hypothetical protein